MKTMTPNKLITNRDATILLIFVTNDFSEVLNIYHIII
tara:strand:+ start:354 stop:467 length:114 start_codon:yes stop_codon:yes gene_type:complete